MGLNKRGWVDWILRFIKGVFVGTGFILPGVSGGALAAIFGLYERMIAFFAHLKQRFKQDIIYFLPVALGMLAGIVLLAYPLSFFLKQYPVPTIWFFAGAILGTLPSLWRQAGKKGRKPRHLAVTGVSAIAGFALLQFGASAIQGGVQQNFATWLLAGVIIALGVLVPGLSPSNFLLYMGMYGAMMDAFKALSLPVLIPIALGMLVCLLAFSKLMDWLFLKVYTGLFHIIMGVVLASTAMIIPLNYNYISLGGLASLLCCGAGVALGVWMSSLEKKYKPQQDEPQ